MTKRKSYTSILPMRLSIQMTSVKILLEKQINNIIWGIHKSLNHIYLIQINVKFQNITYIWTSAYELFTWLYIVGGLKREVKTRINFRKQFPNCCFSKSMSSNVHWNRDVFAAPVNLYSYGQDGHMKRPSFGGTFWQWSGKTQGNQLLRSRLCLQSNLCLGTAQMFNG